MIEAVSNMNPSISILYIKTEAKSAKNMMKSQKGIVRGKSIRQNLVKDEIRQKTCSYNSLFSTGDGGFVEVLRS